MKSHHLVLMTDDSSLSAKQHGNGWDCRRFHFQRYLLTSSVFCTRVAILLATRFCVPLLLCAVAESLPLASAGRMLDLPFGCSFQLRHLLFCLMCKMLECWTSCLAAHIWLAADQLGTLVLAEEKRGTIPASFLPSICLLSHLKINLSFSLSQFCVSKLAAGFVFSLLHC